MTPLTSVSFTRRVGLGKPWPPPPHPPSLGATAACPETRQVRAVCSPGPDANRENATCRCFVTNSHRKRLVSLEEHSLHQCLVNCPSSVSQIICFVIVFPISQKVIKKYGYVQEVEEDVLLLVFLFSVWEYLAFSDCQKKK